MIKGRREKLQGKFSLEKQPYKNTIIKDPDMEGTE